MKRQNWFSVACYAIALFLAAQAVYALTAGTNITLENGTIAVKGPPSLTTCAIDGVPYGAGTSALGCTAAGGANTVLQSGSPPVWGAITNAFVDAAAAIARTKIANGTANHVVINDGSGTLSSEAALAGSRGGLGAAQPTCAANERLTCGGTTCTCSAIPLSLVQFTSMTDLTTSQTIYMGGGTADPTEARACVPVPAGTWGNLRCRQTAAAGASNDVTCTVRKGTCGSEADATVTCSITGGASAASCSDTSNTTSTTAGQCLCVKGTTPAALTNPQYLLGSLERLA